MFSPDDRVKPPFGVAWYGGDAAALPHFDRAATPHAPLVSGGRMFFQGPDRLFAVDVYTGRVIWQIKIEPHQTPYRKDASPVGNYGWRKPLWYSIVALQDRIYLANGNRILVLNPASGNEERKIPLPAGHEYIKDIRVTGGILLAITPTGVVAWDGNSEKSLWSRSTGGVDLQRTESWNGKTKLPGFFAAGNGKVFLVAGVSAAELKHLGVADNAAKGDEPAKYDKDLGKPVGTLAIVALNLKNGKPLWAQPLTGYPSIQYSEAEDVLIQGPMYNGGHGFDLTNKNHSATNAVAYRGKDGRVLWKDYNEAGLYILHSEGLLTQRACLYDFNSGSLLSELSFRRGICAPIGASTHFLTFRTPGLGDLGMRGAAGFYDLSTQRAGSLYSFRPGCGNNMTVGDGMMVAPMYQRGCECSFPIWTSLAMTSRPHRVPSVSRRLSRLAWRLGKDSPASLLALRKNIAEATEKGTDLDAKTMAKFLREIPGITKDLQSTASYRKTGDELVSSELLGIRLDAAFTGTARGAYYDNSRKIWTDRNLLTGKDKTLMPTVALHGAFDAEITATVRFEVTPANRLGPLPDARTVRLGAGKSMNIPWDTFEHNSKNKSSEPFTLKAIADVQFKGIQMRLESIVDVKPPPSGPRFDRRGKLISP